MTQLDVEGLSKEYPTRRESLMVLENVDLASTGREQTLGTQFGRLAP